MKLAWVAPGQALPSPQQALTDPPGLVAAGMDLSPARLLEAYGQGIFPWYSEGQPVLWWSPDPRMVLFPEEFRISRSLKQSLRRALQRGQWEITVDRAFESVMRACAEPRPDQDGTWITEDILQAYVGLHDQGLAHSVEVWAMTPDPQETTDAPKTRGTSDTAGAEDAEDAVGPSRTLIAGLYGVSLGRVFFGESMFTRVRDASKAALTLLVQQLREWQFAFIDCQQQTAHLASMGARPIARDRFLHILSQASHLPAPDWSSTHLNPSLP